MLEGKWPDNADVRVSNNLIGEWTDMPSLVKFNKNDRAHLSHIHIKSEGVSVKE